MRAAGAEQRPSTTEGLGLMTPLRQGVMRKLHPLCDLMTGRASCRSSLLPLQIPRHLQSSSSPILHFKAPSSFLHPLLTEPLFGNLSPSGISSLSVSRSPSLSLLHFPQLPPLECFSSTNKNIQGSPIFKRTSSILSLPPSSKSSPLEHTS